MTDAESSLSRQRASVLRGALLIAVAAALWATTSIAAKTLFTGTDLNPITLGLLRLSVAFPCFFFLMLRERRQTAPTQRPRPGLKPLLVLASLGLFQAAYQGTYLVAVDLTGAAIATLIALCVSPVLVALMAAPLLGEKPSLVTVLALVAAIGGTVLLVMGDIQTSGQIRIAGIAVALLAALVYAGFTLTSRHAAGGTPVFATAFICFFTGALVLLPVVGFSGGFAALPGLSVVDWLMVVYIGLVPTCLGYLCFFAGMKNTPATTSSIIVTLEPLFVAVLAWVFLGENLGSMGILGAVVLTAAVVVASSAGARRR
ncbi:DMT family transporter [Marinobacter caseinilyticus]|uniref:DMT family transporter n=1 Tax=Marinobacter caseinilyticus TaxID=2692195 RepID=UPI00140E8DF6|nr:EamA family transporter [Marinobacter caseinilyticus]